MAWLVVSNSVIPNNMQNRFYNHIIASIICIMADFQNGSFSRIFGAFWSACLHRTNLILNLLYCGKKKTKKSKKKLKSKKQKNRNTKMVSGPSGLPYDIDMEGGLNVSEKQMSDNAFLTN